MENINIENPKIPEESWKETLSDPYYKDINTLEDYLKYCQEREKRIMERHETLKNNGNI